MIIHGIIFTVPGLEYQLVYHRAYSMGSYISIIRSHRIVCKT